MLRPLSWQTANAGHDEAIGSSNASLQKSKNDSSTCMRSTCLSVPLGLTSDVLVGGASGDGLSTDDRRPRRGDFARDAFGGGWVVSTSSEINNVKLLSSALSPKPAVLKSAQLDKLDVVV